METKNMNHTPGHTAEINKLGYWIPVIYYPYGHRAEVGNAQHSKARAEEVAERLWSATLRIWKREASVKLMYDAQEYVVARRNKARASLRVARIYGMRE